LGMDPSQRIMDYIEILETSRIRIFNCAKPGVSLEKYFCQRGNI
jgi:hypothetical protein